MQLKQAQQIAEALKAELSPFCERIEIGGSIRRKKPDPGDIELVCIPKFIKIGSPQVTLTMGHIEVEHNHLFDYLAVNYEGRIIKIGEKYAQIQIGDEADVSIKVDIFTATESTWGYIFLLRTGSAEFSQWTVTELKRRGFVPKGGEISYRLTPCYTPNESDVFDLLELDYIEPENRTEAQ